MYEPVADPVPAPTVDLDAELAAVARAWDEALADDCWAEGLALRRVVSAARAELSVLRAREAQVRDVVEHWGETARDRLLAVLDGTTGSGETG